MPVCLPAPPFSGLPVNTHIHLPPNFSAFDTVEQAVDLAAAQGLRVLGASNYFDYQVYGELERRAREAGIYPLFGLEVIALLPELRDAGIRINDPGNPGKLYLCGKGLTRFALLSAEGAELLAVIRENDGRRMAAMIDRLGEFCAAAGLEVGLDEARIKAAIVRRHGSPPETVYLQERHLAQAFQEALFERLPEGGRAEALERLFGAVPARPDDPVAVQNDLRSHLMKAGKPAFVPEAFVGFDHAYGLVLALGGIPCYPILADGAAPVCAFEEPVERLVPELRSRGIHAAELIPIRNRPEVLERYARALRGAGMVVTAGTEHNTLDLLPLEPRCADGSQVADDLRAIFWEGACVVAAHQERVRRREPGFVDAAGRPNPAFASDEARIRAFAELGREAIAAAGG